MTCSRRSTGEVCQRTVQRRSQEVQQVRKIIGGDDSALILHQELRSLTKDERSKLLLDAGLTIDIPPEQGLAMKADLAIPWHKLRVIRRLNINKIT